MIVPFSRAGRNAVFVAALLLAAAPVAHAFDVPPNDGFVTDTAGLLTKQQDAALEAGLQQYKDQTSNEIAVVILPTLGGEAIEDVGLAVARKWGVGSKAKNNGILMVIGYAEHEVRFDVGYGLEGAVPDLVARGIIDTDIVPKFRSGDYNGGITAAIDSLRKHIAGEYTADRYAAKAEDGYFSPAFFIALFILFQWLISILGRTKSWWLGGVFGGLGGVVLAVAYGWWLSIPLLIPLGLLLDFIVSKNYQARGRTSWWAGGGWGPGGGGRGSGGGFGGFGGGGFGGGGASGRW